MKRSGHAISSHSGFILSGASWGGGAEGPHFFLFGDWASLLSQGLDKRSATDSSIHETVVRNPIDLFRGRPQVIQIPSGLPLPEVKIAEERGAAFVILYHLQTVRLSNLLRVFSYKDEKP